jgi:predicted enzyme related to lactoylglutathione lyase
VSDSADVAAERAQKAGGKVLMGAMEGPGGDRVAVLSDPQGVAFAVHSKP